MVDNSRLRPSPVAIACIVFVHYFICFYEILIITFFLGDFIRKISRFIQLLSLLLFYDFCCAACSSLVATSLAALLLRVSFKLFFVEVFFFLFYESMPFIFSQVLLHTYIYIYVCMYVIHEFKQAKKLPLMEITSGILWLLKTFMANA